jgi:hypothetical protein
MGRPLPRVVIVTRPPPLEHWPPRHSTPGQVRFFLESRGRSITPYEVGHRLREEALEAVRTALPADQPRTRIDRSELDRFVFRGDDIVAVVGQDGLVANVSKYLAGQLVIGVNPDQATFDGVLCRHTPEGFADAIEWTTRPSGNFTIQRRVMAEAMREDGQRLLALNEFFIGSRTHQSARYLINVGGVQERQSSSGILVVTGTGATGWGLSVARQRGLQELLPAPEDRQLAWFVREPFPSVSTGTELNNGSIAEDAVVEAVSEMGEGGVVFADGIEPDNLEFLDGQSVQIRVASETLNLLVSATHPTPTRQSGVAVQAA